MNSHEIDYTIEGNDMQVVSIELDPGETVIAEAGTGAVDLVATVDPGMAIVSFGVDIRFDGAVLDTVDAVVNASVFDAGELVDFSTDGLIELSGFVSPVSTPGGASGALVLATLTFFGEALGVTELEARFPGPTEGFGLRDGPPFSALPDTVSPGSLQVPEAGTAPLLLAAVGAALALRPRRRVGLTPASRRSPPRSPAAGPPRADSPRTAPGGSAPRAPARR